jgi:hypothetical protein
MVGYLRVSALDQKELRQLDGITVARRFTDKAREKTGTGPNSSNFWSTSVTATLSCVMRWTNWPATWMISAKLF